MSLGSRLLSLFRSAPTTKPAPALGPHRPELQGGDFVPKREIYPLLTFSGWTPDRIMFAVDQHDQGIFSESELLYHAMRKEGLIASALNTRVSLLREFPWDLVVPKEAPEEFHAFTEILKKDWQQVMSDEDRGEIDERMIMFGFSVCSVHWTFQNGQRQMRLKPWTHSSLMWRWDWWAFQGTTQDGGICRIENDGREWVIFSKGGTRPWLKGAIRELAYVWFGLMTGDDGWLALNDGFGRPIKKWKTPRLMRESKEALDGYDKVRQMRAADTAMCPQDEKGYGYDLTYVQADAQGYQTFSSQLQRYDDRVAIILLGHNLSQRVSSGSLAATKEATGITRLLAEADARIISAGFENVSAVWARANFGESWEDDNPDLTGGTEAYTWKLVFDTKPPEDKKEASQTAQAFGSGMAALAKQMDLSEVPIDKEKSAERAGFILLPEEKREAFRIEARRQKEEADKQAAEIAKAQTEKPPKHGNKANEDSDGSAPTAEKPQKLADDAPILVLASGDEPSSVAGLLEGQAQIDRMADEDEDSGAPALATILAALAAATDWSDLRGRLADIVRTFDLRDAQSTLRERLRAANTIGSLSVDHDLAPALRAEVDASDRRRSQTSKVDEMRGQHERASVLARGATAYALYSIARHLWDGADRAAAQGQPLEVHKEELSTALRSTWGPGGALWDTARTEPLQHAFTSGRYLRLSSEPLRAVLSYWMLDAVLDGRTTPLCRSINGYTRPAGDPGFPIPPLHWRCRTTIRGLSRAEGEARLTASRAWAVDPGFGGVSNYPAPNSGPEELLTAYRSRA